MIYKKLADLQKILMEKKFKKSGYNKFGNFYYYELEDLLPFILQECYKKEIVLDFTFTDTEAILKFRDWNTPGESISTRLPMPPIKELNRKMNIMQSEGSYITYLKRYLLVNLFLIVDKDVIDSEGLSEFKKELNEIKNEGVLERPDLINDLITIINKKGLIPTKDSMMHTLNNNKKEYDSKEVAKAKKYIIRSGEW